MRRCTLGTRVAKMAIRSTRSTIHSTSSLAKNSSCQWMAISKRATTMEQATKSWRSRQQAPSGISILLRTPLLESSRAIGLRRTFAPWTTNTSLQTSSTSRKSRKTATRLIRITRWQQLQKMDRLSCGACTTSSTANSSLYQKRSASTSPCISSNHT